MPTNSHYRLSVHKQKPQSPPTWRLLVASVLFCGFTPVANAEGNSHSVLAYNFSDGMEFNYKIDVIREINDTANGEVRAGKIHQIFQANNKVQSINEDSGEITFLISFPALKFDFGTPESVFDSTNVEQMKQVQSEPKYFLHGAILSSKSTLRVDKNGNMDFFRRKSVDPLYEERTLGMLDKVLQDNADFLTFSVPDPAISEGGTWKRQMPVKLVGGFLGGQTIHLDVNCHWVRTEAIDGENCAVLELKLEKQPDLPLTGDSLKDVEAHLNVAEFSGKIHFSLKHGHVLSNAMSLKTKFTMAYQGAIQDDHSMLYSYVVTRTKFKEN